MPGKELMNEDETLSMILSILFCVGIFAAGIGLGWCLYMYQVGGCHSVY